MEDKRIITGIYGGSFNPIHDGHTLLAEALCKTGLIDELWFVVSPHNPHKQQDDLLHDEARLQLARLAVSQSSCIQVSDVEFHLSRPSYMIHTLQYLSQHYPEREFVLVIGADNWERFPLWYKSEEILAQYRIIIYPRQGYSLHNLSPQVVVAQTPLIPLASTDIRNAIRKGTYNGIGIHPAVWEEIKKKGYYV